MFGARRYHRRRNRNNRCCTGNRVLADVWYTSPQPGELLLKWLGEGDEPPTTIVKAGEKNIRITSRSTATWRAKEGHAKAKRNRRRAPEQRAGAAFDGSSGSISAPSNSPISGPQI